VVSLLADGNWLLARGSGDLLFAFSLFLVIIKIYFFLLSKFRLKAIR